MYNLNKYNSNTFKITHLTIIYESLLMVLFKHLTYCKLECYIKSITNHYKCD